MKSWRIRSRSVCSAVFLLSALLSAPAWGYEKEIDALSALMAEKIAQAGKQTVAVVDFTDLEGNVSQLDQFIAEEFSVALAGAGKGFRVIDRTHLKSIIKENKLSATGLIDPATASKLGKIAGVDALVTGTLTPFGDNVRLAVKVLDAETAEVIDAAKSNIAKTQAIEELLGNQIAQESPAMENTKPVNRETRPSMLTTQVMGFTFELKECKKSGEFVTCSLFIISNNEDKEIKIWAHNGGDRSVIYDDIGNEYTASKVQLGGQSERYELSRRLVTGVPTETSFEFQGINHQASRIALFEIQCYAAGEYFTAQFRNIPLAQ